MLEKHGFVRITKKSGGSHTKYEAVIDNKKRIVIVSGHRKGDDVPLGTLASIIRQSGLPKKHFR